MGCGGDTHLMSDSDIKYQSLDLKGLIFLAWKLSDESEEEQTQGGTLSNNYNSASSKGFVTGVSICKYNILRV